jgi:zinc-ribbon domain
MFCKSCGRQIDNDSSFCSFCGTKQSADLKPQVQADTNQSNNTTQKIYSNETNFNNSPSIVRQPKYDPTYKKEDDAMTFGIILLVIALIFAIVGPIKFEDRESYGQFRAVTAIVSLILRIGVTIWVVNIAKRQNRETFGWGLFAFLLPSIALIVIATRKKLFANVQIVDGLDSEQNSKILSDKAQEFYNESKYSESIRFSEKAIELNPNNEIATDILKKSKIAIAGINNVGSSTQTVFRETTDDKLLKIVSKLNQTIGADVFIDDLPASDGIYNYKTGTHKLLIENGKIKERYFIERVKNIVVEKTNEHSAQKGDKVFLDTGSPAPTGKYSMGFMASKLIVEDGKFVRYE